VFVACGAVTAVDFINWHQMRTTLQIEDEALEIVRDYAQARNISLGRAVSELVCVGHKHLPKLKAKNGWVVHELPAGSPLLTQERLDQIKNQEFAEEFQRSLAPGH
jgi:hypothetical protein